MMRTIVGATVAGAMHVLIEEVEGRGQWATLWHVEDEQGRGWDLMGRPQELLGTEPTSEGYLLRHIPAAATGAPILVQVRPSVLDVIICQFGTLLSEAEGSLLPPALRDREVIISAQADGRRFGMLLQVLVIKLTKQVP